MRDLLAERPTENTYNGKGKLDIKIIKQIQAGRIFLFMTILFQQK